MMKESIFSHGDGDCGYFVVCIVMTAHAFSLFVDMLLVLALL